MTKRTRWLLITAYCLRFTDPVISLTIADCADTISSVYLTYNTQFSVGTIFHILFYQPTYNLLIVFYTILAGNLGLAIIAVAVLSRLITYPMTKAQIQQAKKGKDFQKKFNEIKKKYKKNQEKMQQELAKIQAEYLPGQIAGCLPLIIMIILLIQVRAGIINLVNEGWHSFNEIAYVSSLKKQEDFIKYTPTDELDYGKHVYNVKLTTDGGNFVEKQYNFEVVENVEERKEQILNEEKGRSKDERSAEKQAEAEKLKAERDTNIALYNPIVKENTYGIAISKTLIFTTDSVTVTLLDDRTPDLEVYIRPPSNQNISVDSVEVKLDETVVTDNSNIQKGEPINLSFLGMDLSKAAADFSWSNATIIPYVVLAVLLGVTQYGSTKILTGIRSVGEEKKKKQTEAKASDKKKSKKKDEEIPDMGDMMTAMNKQMAFMFPALTIITSLGYWGGSNLFPAGLSVFWTVQSLFVIIQQLLMNREKVITLLKSKLKRD